MSSAEPLADLVRQMAMANHRPQGSLLLMAVCSALFGGSACSADEGSPANERSVGSTVGATATNEAASPVETPAGRFDALSISLELRSTTVRQGKTLRSRATIENKSSAEVVDPACVISEGRYALVPADDPDAELWVTPLTDCAGPSRMPPGYRSEYRGPDFSARTKYGAPLPPGEYVAVLDIDGLTQRLEYPVTVIR